MSTELAIIIPAKNEEKNIYHLLHSLKFQDYPDTYNVYLADANSSDYTKLVASKVYTGLKIVGGGLPAVGRNNGAFMSDSKYYLFLDADVILQDSTFIRRVISVMNKKNLDCVTTDIHTNGNWKSKSMYLGNNICQRASRFFGIPYSTGMCMFFRSMTFWELGGFNEKVKFAEDFELSRKVNPKKFRVIGGGVLTSDRRFKKTGYWKMITLFIKTALGYNVWDNDYWKVGK